MENAGFGEEELLSDTKTGTNYSKQMLVTLRSSVLCLAFQSPEPSKAGSRAGEWPIPGNKTGEGNTVEGLLSWSPGNKGSMERGEAEEAHYHLASCHHVRTHLELWSIGYLIKYTLLIDVC